MLSKFNFDEVKKRLEQSRREMLVLLSNQAQNYFLRSFKNQGFNGEAWENVKRREEGTSEYKYPKTKGLQRRTQPILTGAGWKKRGGTLRRAVSNMARTAEITGTGLRMIVDLPYAAIHNEGGEGKAFGKYSFTMPKRTFIGQTGELTNMQRATIDKTIKKIWNV